MMLELTGKDILAQREQAQGRPGRLAELGYLAQGARDRA